KTGRLAVLRFSRARPHRAKHSATSFGDAYAPLELLHPGEGHTAQISAQDRDGVARSIARGHIFLCGARGAAEEPRQTFGTRKERRDAIFAEERYSLRGDGGRGNGGARAQHGREGRELGRPGAKI